MPLNRSSSFSTTTTTTTTTTTAATTTTTTATAAATAARPHILFVVIDDMGYNDAGYQSTDLGGAGASATPHLDSLAAAGVKLSSYYSAPFCTPARASLLTGRHFAELGMLPNDAGVYYPSALPQAAATLPDLLRSRCGPTRKHRRRDVRRSRG